MTKEITTIILTPPSNEAVYMFGFMFGTMCCITDRNTDPRYRRANLISAPLSTLFAASIYGGLTAIGAGLVASLMPKRTTPAIPILLTVSTAYLIYSLFKDTKKDDE